MSVAAVVAAVVIQPAEAAACGPPEKVFTVLRSTHGEMPEWGGRGPGPRALVMTISPVGSWSLVEFMRPNFACVIRSGKGGYFYHGKPPKIHSPDTAPS